MMSSDEVLKLYNVVEQGYNYNAQAKQPVIAFDTINKTSTVYVSLRVAGQVLGVLDKIRPHIIDPNGLHIDNMVIACKNIVFIYVVYDQN